MKCGDLILNLLHLKIQYWAALKKFHLSSPYQKYDEAKFSSTTIMI